MRVFVGVGLVAILAVILPAKAAALFEDVIVPEGSWGARVMLDLETQDSTVDRASRTALLINYVIPDDDVRAQVEGGIERSRQQFDFLFTYGVSDQWNISLNIPFVEFEQDSSLSTNSTDPEVAALVDRLQSETLSGFGDLTLTSLHRPLFSDWNAFLWGYGLIKPLGGQENPYEGTQTFDIRSPASSLFLFLHYTRYPGIRGARFDARGWAAKALKETVSVPGGEAPLVLGNRVSLKFGWSQEMGPVTLGLEGEFFDQRTSTVGPARTGDQARAQFLRLHLGFGNLAGLETGPLAFPYRLDIQFESLERGSNVPQGNRVRVALQTFF